MTIGRVAQLWRYPVKSLGGEQVEQAEFGPRGVLGDRLWAVRDLERDVTASARQLPVLLTATARYLGPVPPDAGPGNVPEVEITFPDGAVLSSSDGGVHAKLSELAGRDVELTALPPAEDTSLHRLNREQRADAMSPASLRAAFGVSDGEKLPDLSMVRVSDLVTLDLAGAGGGAVQLPVGPQRDDLALVVDSVGEHTFGGDLVPGGSDHDVADVGFLVAALVGLLEVERELARCDRHVVELRDRVLTAVAFALRVEVRRPDRILDDGVVGEHREPGLFVACDRGLAGTLARHGGCSVW